MSYEMLEMILSFTMLPSNIDRSPKTVAVLGVCALPILLISDDHYWVIVFLKYLFVTFLAGFVFFSVLDELKLRLCLYDSDHFVKFKTETEMP